MGLRATLGAAAVVWVLSQVQWHDRIRLSESHAWIEGRIVSDRLDEEGYLLFEELGSEEPRTVLLFELHRPPDLEPNSLYAASSLEVGLAYIGLRARWIYLILGILLVSLQYVITPIRWALLLRVLTVPLRPSWIFSLNIMGNFAANVMPGGTATGDLLKALYAYRLTGRCKTEAALSVFLDRFLGFFGMVLLGTLALCAHMGQERLRPAAWACLGVVGLLTLAGMVLLSFRLQKFLRLSWLAKRLPGQATAQRLQNALSILRKHPNTLLAAGSLSLLNWSLLVVANFLLARGLGLTQVPLSVFFVAVPAAGLAFLVPFLPGGWGVGEASYVFLFTNLSNVSPSLAVALSLVFRLSHTLWSIPGAMVFVFLSSEKRSGPSSGPVRP
jgi:uncharacterized protein (TIRG00374 family)